jgi:putative transposase
MPGPKALGLELSAQEREELQTLVRRHTTAQQIARRGRILLLADAAETNSEIARQLDLDVDTVRAWRSRWRALQAVHLTDLSIEERLADLPRPGRRARITAEQVVKIVALACEAPTESGRPITQWTGREIAEEVMRRGIVEQISPRHASRLVKRGISNRTSCATG